jgi:hypothetical protein
MAFLGRVIRRPFFRILAVTWSLELFERMARPIVRNNSVLHSESHGTVNMKMNNQDIGIFRIELGYSASNWDIPHRKREEKIGIGLQGK